MPELGLSLLIECINIGCRDECCAGRVDYTTRKIKIIFQIAFLEFLWWINWSFCQGIGFMHGGVWTCPTHLLWAEKEREKNKVFPEVWRGLEHFWWLEILRLNSGDCAYLSYSEAGEVIIYLQLAISVDYWCWTFTSIYIMISLYLTWNVNVLFRPCWYWKIHHKDSEMQIFAKYQGWTG